MNSGSQAILHGVPDGRSAAEVFWKLVLGSWKLVLGSWKLVLGSWKLVLGSWKLVFGVGSSGDRSWYWRRVKEYPSPPTTEYRSPNTHFSSRSALSSRSPPL